MNQNYYLKILLLSVAFLGLIASAASRETFGGGQNEPLPNITDIRIYDVTGLSSTLKETDGTLVDQGINETFILNQSEKRSYRFTFRIVNEDDSTSWDIDSSDTLYHKGLKSTWDIQTSNIWYNYSGSEYHGGSFSSGKVSWDTSSGPTVATNDVMWAKYIVNISQSSSNTFEEKFKVNDTENSAGSRDNHKLRINKLGFLNLTLDEPPNDTTVGQNRTFTMNATIICEDGECGEVEASARYNESSSADTLISDSEAEPFYTIGTNTKVCSSKLNAGEKCTTEWSVNATGKIESFHLLDVNASSSFSKIKNNETKDSLVQINEIFMINLSWDTTRFGVLDPGSENNSAEGNKNLLYNLTVEENSDSVDRLWTKASDITAESSDYVIGASNMSFSTTNDIDTETFYSKNYQKVDSNLKPGEIINFFFWLDVPTGLLKGEYNGTLYFKANNSG